MANPEHLARLREGAHAWNEWRRHNLSEKIDLSDTFFQSGDLEGMQVRSFGLRDVSLKRIHVSGSEVSRPDLAGADLRGADLSDAVLWYADLSNARLSDATLTGANLSNAVLCDAVFEKADLRWANLSNTEATGAFLNNANLGSANLSNATFNGADLREAHLGKAALHGTRFVSANLIRADLREVDAVGAAFAECNLNGANLRFAKLGRADFRGADLRTAQLDHADLSGANLTGAALFRAGLTTANLTGATLTGADFRAATLLQATLNECIANDMMLWETQRSGWKIKNIVCKRALWDKDAREPTSYEPGEFERLYSDQTIIELFYQGGVSTFELNTLPALLQHIASLHAKASIRLRSIEETGGGARISISVGDADDATAEAIKADAMQVYRAQLLLRDNDMERLKIENRLLNSQNDKLIQALLTSGTQHNTFNAPVYGAALPSGNARVELNQTVNDNAEIVALLGRMFDRRHDLNLAPADAERLAVEVDSARAELEKPAPNPTALARSLKFVQKIAATAATRAAEKLGEQVVSVDWQSMLHQLSQYVQHLG